MTRSTVLLAALTVGAAACAPNNAELTNGIVTAWLSDTTDPTVQDGNIKYDEVDEHMAIDCRLLDEEDENYRLDGANMDLCEGGTVRYVDGNGDRVPIAFETWINNGAFHVVTENLEPWRGEGILTSEGDFQVTFHHRLPGGDDFRFAFVLDPEFSPRRCVPTEDGGVEWESIDGDWVENWSAYMQEDAWSGGGTDGTLYLLNAQSFQWDPDPQVTAANRKIWPLPDEWQAGYAYAKFGSTDLGARGARYGMPAIYGVDISAVPASQIFYVAMDEGEDPTQNSAFQQEISRAYGVAGVTGSELSGIGTPSTQQYQPQISHNEWRIPDGRRPGLDGWVGMHYNWVRLDQSPDQITSGEPASGEFHLMFESIDSESKIVVHGNFSIDRVRKDRWVTRVVEEDKLEENETVLCGEAYSGE